MEEKELKNGYTTGTCATAAVKVALEALVYGKKATEVDITTLNYTNLKIPVQKLRVRNFLSQNLKFRPEFASSAGFALYSELCAVDFGDICRDG